MSDVISLQKHKKSLLQKKGKQSTLCGNGFHSWEVVKENSFDVKKGKLVTQYCCKRCGATKVEAS
jgi:hypothetical protein